jgi:Papain family cysteine protease
MLRPMFKWHGGNRLPAGHPLMLMGKAESAKRISVRTTPPPQAASSPAKISPAAVTKIIQRAASKCVPFEVSPGVYARLDCHKYSPIPTAKAVNTARKMQMFKAGQLRLDPQEAGAVQPSMLAVGQSVEGATPEQLPDTVDHRTQGIEGPVKDQGVVGSCTAFSLSTVMDNAIRRLNKSEATSSLHIWSHYGDPHMTSAASANSNRPIAIWPDYPYNQAVACKIMKMTSDDCAEALDPPVTPNTAASDPAIQAQIKAADAKGRYKITEIAKLPIDPEVMAVELGTGKDIWAGIMVGISAWTGKQMKTTGVIPDYDAEDGGHAIAFAGVRKGPGGRQFLIHNSWGPGWGDGGYAWISEKMIVKHLIHAYTIKVTDVGAPPPLPTPLPDSSGACASGYTQTPEVPVCQRLCTNDAACGPAGVCVNVSPTSSQMVCVATSPLTDDDCGEEEVVDAVTGLCAPICGNGMRPAAAQC